MKGSNKICIVSSTIPPNFSGAGVLAYEYALRLYKRNKLAFILTEKSEPTIKGVRFEFKRFKKLSSNMVVTVPRDVNEGKIRTKNKVKYFIPFAMWQISLLYSIFWRMFQNRNSFKIVHCIGASSWLNLYSVLVGKFLGKKTVLEMQLLGSDDPVSLKKSPNILIGNFCSWLFSKADIIISISPALTKAYKFSGMPIEKLKEVPNTVDINKFYPINRNEKINMRKRLGFEQNHIIILCVGAIIKRKGIDLLIKSFARYINKYSFNATLVLIGPTAKNKENLQFYNKMKKLAKDLNIERHIIFTGTRDNIDEYMKISDLFVFLSRNEGFGTVLIEAMSTGLPVIALNIPGITEYIIQNGVDGIILYEENSDKVALTIEKILSNQNVYNSISINSRKTAISRFSTEIIDEQYKQIYNEISKFD